MIHQQVEETKIRRRVRLGEIMGAGMDDTDSMDDLDQDLDA